MYRQDPSRRVHVSRATTRLKPPNPLSTTSTAITGAIAPLTRRSHFLPPTRCRRRPSLPLRSLLEVVCPLPLLGRSHAWLVRKPDLVWQILTDFLGGRATLRRSSFKRALRKGISAPPPPTRTNERRSLALRFPTAASFATSLVVRQQKEHSCSG